MNKDNEHFCVSFHDKARAVFYAYLEDFTNAVTTLDRKKDEGVFRLQRESYVNSLQQKLTQIAEEVLSENRRSPNLDQLSQNINHYLSDYIYQFVQKINAM